MNHDAGCTCDRCWSTTLRGAIASGTLALCERAIANHFAPPAPTRAPSRPAAPRRPPVKRLRNPEPPLAVAALVSTVAEVAPKKRRGRPPKVRPAAVDQSPPASTFPHLVDDQLELPAIAAPAIAAPEPAIAIEPEVARLAPAPVRPAGTGTPCRVCGVDDGADRAQRDLHLHCVEAAVPRKKPAARTRAPRPARPAAAPPRGRLAVIARLAAKHTRKAERMAARRDRERLDPDHVDEADADEEEALPSLRDLTHG